MHVRIVRAHLPRLAGVTLGIRRGRDPVDPVDAISANEPVVFEIEIVINDGDCRGPWVPGRRGERFVYLVPLPSLPVLPPSSTVRRSCANVGQ